VTEFGTRQVFVDTSALYSLFDRDDAEFDEASRLWSSLCASIADGEIVARTHNAVVLETSALLQNRLGVSAVRDLHDLVLPAIAVRWVDEALHDRAVVATIAAGRRRVSLVDWLSFMMMRQEGIDLVFAFDDDFAAQGFELFGR
jgi:predicted nucleic acid-binding protein